MILSSWHRQAIVSSFPFLSFSHTSGYFHFLSFSLLLTNVHFPNDVSSKDRISSGLKLGCMDRYLLISRFEGKHISRGESFPTLNQMFVRFFNQNPVSSFSHVNTDAMNILSKAKNMRGRIILLGQNVTMLQSPLVLQLPEVLLWKAWKRWTLLSLLEKKLGRKRHELWLSFFLAKYRGHGFLATTILSQNIFVYSLSRSTHFHPFPVSLTHLSSLTQFSLSLLLFSLSFLSLTVSSCSFRSVCCCAHQIQPWLRVTWMEGREICAEQLGDVTIH